MDVLALILPPAFGFLIGFVTNALAIRMLFRPYKEVRFLGLRVQGMVPRRKADIARTVSRTVVSELLREERVGQRMTGADVREAFETLLLGLADRYLERDYGPLVSTLGPARLKALEEAATQVIVEAGRALESWVATDEGREAIRSLAEALLDRPASEYLKGEESLVSRIVVGKVMEALAAPDLEERIRLPLAGLLVRLAGTGKPVGSYLPEEAKEAFLRTVGYAVPTLLRRFEQALLSGPNVEKIKAAVRSGIEAYLLETEGGVVKNLARQAAFLARDRIFQEVDEVVDANLPRLGELVYEEENRAQVEVAIQEGLNAILNRRPSELLGALPAETLDALYGRVASGICSYLRRPPVTDALANLIEREVRRLFEIPLGDLVRASGAEQEEVARWALKLAQWASQGGIESVARREAPRLAHVLVNTPVGRPSRYLPRSLVREFTGLALDQLMPLVSSKTPEILRIVDVQGLIEREILDFSPQEVERVILSVARRELWAITWWGGVLGTAVGSIQTAMTLLG